MEKSIFQHEVSAGIGISDLEFFVDETGEVKFIQDGRMYPFDELTCRDLDRLKNEIDNDPKAISGLELLGINDPIEQIRKFTACRYGKLDNVLDLSSESSVSEYWDCGCHAICPADGMLCKFPKVKKGNLTKHEMRIIRLIGHDYPNKTISDMLKVSLDTINKEVSTIVRKLGCFTKNGVAYFAGTHNIC